LKELDFMLIRAHVYIFGRVQGVFFRSEIRRKARQLKVNGWVRNLPDDQVEAIFEGEEKDVKRLVEFCKVGPYGAIVEKTKVELGKHIGEFRDFQVTW
jgi:acylphosphatase